MRSHRVLLVRVFLSFHRISPWMSWLMPDDDHENLEMLSRESHIACTFDASLPRSRTIEGDMEPYACGSRHLNSMHHSNILHYLLYRRISPRRWLVIHNKQKQILLFLCVTRMLRNRYGYCARIYLESSYPRQVASRYQYWNEWHQPIRPSLLAWSRAEYCTVISRAFEPGEYQLQEWDRVCAYTVQENVCTEPFHWLLSVRFHRYRCILSARRERHIFERARRLGWSISYLSDSSWLRVRMLIWGRVR